MGVSLRYRWMLLIFFAVLRPALAGAQSLKVNLEGDQLHLGSSNPRLLSAEARLRLHNGATVTYAFRVTVAAKRGSAAGNSVSYHCVFSFDLWEEKYKVLRLEPGYRSASHLTQTAAEQLCLESLVIPVGALSAASPFWILLEYQLEDRQSSDPRNDPDSIPAILVDIFSRRTKEPQPVDTLEGGPFRLADLRKAIGGR